MAGRVGDLLRSHYASPNTEFLTVPRDHPRHEAEGDETGGIVLLTRPLKNGGITTRGSFPSEDAAEKLIYLAIRGHEKTSRTVRGWLTAVNQFAIMFEDRFKPIQG